MFGDIFDFDRNGKIDAIEHKFVIMEDDNAEIFCPMPSIDVRMTERYVDFSLSVWYN